jgi:twitching motility protein PilT
VVDDTGLNRARQTASQTGASISRTLVALRLATEQQIVAALAAQLGLPYADCAPGSVDPEAARLLPRSLALELNLLPVAFGPDGGLTVAACEPEFAGLDRVAAATGLPVTGALAPRDDLRRAIDALTTDDPQEAAPPARRTPPALAAPAAPAAGAPGLLASEEEPPVDLHAILSNLLDVGGSDLHLTAGSPPMVRLHGDLRPMEGYPVLEPRMLQSMLYSILTQKQRERFENDLELDLSTSLPGKARFRVNVFQQRDSMGAVMRTIPHEIKPLEELGIPPRVRDFCFLPRGFVLVTGPTGSGKSTTLASLLDVINRERPSHIMTVEDPIEFLHRHRRSLVNQRELGTDTHSFAAALKHVLRQDPDVILVGELRDLETIQIALTAAETGHLVFATLHTQDAPQTVDRIIDVFPPAQQEQIRVMLSGALQGVVCQQLLKTADGKGRAAACEVMVATSAIRNLIREGKTHQMYSALQAGRAQGMVTMDQSLADLVVRGRVAYAEALEYASSVPEFNRLCGRG